MVKNGSDGPETANEPRKSPKIQILRQYIRDFSFENIMAQKGVSDEVTPEISVQVSIDAKKRAGGSQYDVLCKYSVTSKNKGKKDETLFLLELEYCGLFQIENLPEQQLHPFLLIECPRLLFPFARRIVADITREGGFPPLSLELIDFAALYRQATKKGTDELAKSGS